MTTATLVLATTTPLLNKTVVLGPQNKVRKAYQKLAPCTVLPIPWFCVPVGHFDFFSPLLDLRLCCCLAGRTLAIQAISTFSTPKWDKKSLPKTSPLSTVLPSARTCGCQDKEPAHKYSTQHVIFSGVTLRKTCTMWTPKMGCKIWTPVLESAELFFLLSRPPKWGSRF